MNNDIVELDITGSGAEMEGVARLDGMAVFVPGALPGERVRAHIVKRAPRFANAELVEVLAPSPERTQPACPMAGRCGGCSLMHMTYQATLNLKAQHIRDCLERIGGARGVFTAMHGMDSPWGYRNRAQFPVGGSAGAPRVGFYCEGTHEVVDLPKGCMLVDPRINAARAAFAAWLRESGLAPYDGRTRRGLVRHAVFRVSRAGALMAIIVVNGSRLPGHEALWQRLERVGCVSLVLNELTDAPGSRRNTEIFGRRFVRLCGADTYVDEILGCRFELSAPSFFQINPLMTDRLYALAAEYAALRDGEVLLDAYCGAGTIGLTLMHLSRARHGRLIGIESVPEAVENARRNAELNGAGDARFICGRCEDELGRLTERGLCPDVAVIDPPRKGCDAALMEALGELGRRSLGRIVYISCNPATLARDIGRLREWGWEPTHAEGVDMFGWTSHVETVVLLSKGEVDSKKIRVEFSLEDMSEFQDGATYPQIKEYVLEHTGLKVSSLYISQVKRKCGLEVGKNYNLPKSVDSKQPQCPPEKEAAIMEA